VTAEAPPSGGGELGARSLVDLVVARVRADILRGAFAPGEHLVEEQLTRRFGTSRAPLREALRLLGQQGLVEHLPRRGVRVTELSARDMDELFGLRDALERFALGTALEQGAPDPGRLAALEQAVVGIEQAGDVGEERAEAHRDFHLALVGLAGHRHLLRVYEPVLLQLQLYMATNMRREAAVRTPEEGARRHRTLYDAIASGDQATALAALESHGTRTYLAPELDDAAR
jgi:DNA-binding GntR family transcriptional regulator